MGYYIVLINVLAFSLMGIDKYKAKHNKWRIKERDLFLLSFLGGAIGSYFGMYMFHHKTQTSSFKFGIPLLIALNLIFYYLIALI